MASVTSEELKSFHSIDRELYTRLVINLRRELGQSMQVIALWILLEQMEYPNIILKMLSLPDSLVNAIADEAVICLNCIESSTPPPPTSINNIPLTLRLMNKDISLQFLHANRLLALNGIANMVNNVCAKAFDDIVQRALLINVGHGVRTTGEGLRPIGEETKPQMMIMSKGPLLGPSVRPRFPNPSLGSGIGGASNVSPHLYSIESHEGSSSHPVFNPMAQPWNPNEDVPQDDRTLFVTFSRGYPMTEDEIKDFFVRIHGDCIEAIHMQDVPPSMQPLYARIIFRTAAKIPIILDGKEKAKFSINGKHVWARRYVAKTN